MLSAWMHKIGSIMSLVHKGTINTSPRVSKINCRNGIEAPEVNAVVLGT